MKPVTTADILELMHASIFSPALELGLFWMPAGKPLSALVTGRLPARAGQTVTLPIALPAPNDRKIKIKICPK